MVRVWDTTTGTKVATLTGHTDGVLGVSFSPDGSRIATCGRDQIIRIWSVATFEEFGQLAGHSSYVYSVAFSPDGTILVSSSGDYTIRIHPQLRLLEEIEERQQRRTLPSQKLTQRLTVFPINDLVCSLSPGRLNSAMDGRVKTGHC